MLLKLNYKNEVHQISIEPFTIAALKEELKIIYPKLHLPTIKFYFKKGAFRYL